MKKSLIPQISKAVLNKLESSESKDVSLFVKGDDYIILEDKEQFDKNGDYLPPKGYEPSWKSTVIGFNYSDSPLPTIEDIEHCLYNTFIKVL